jgi:RNA polymerase sigma-70 factor (ECF subfamily)
MDARSAGRRKRREALATPPSPRPALAAADDGTFIAILELPRSARVVAILALHGLTRDEIASILDLSPEALRQRIATLRKKWNQLPEESRERTLEAARKRRTLGQELESGLIRQALVAWLHEVPGVGTHDPDGHLIVLGKSSPSRTSGRRQHDRTEAK